MLSVAGSLNINFSIYHILPEYYDQIDNYNYSLEQSEIISIQNFQIKNILYIQKVGNSSNIREACLNA